MSRQQNIWCSTESFWKGISGGRDPTEIAALFDADLVFEIQGDDGVLPWIGRKTGRQAVADFIRDIRTLTEPVTFDVECTSSPATAAPQSSARCGRGSRRPARLSRPSSRSS